MCYHCTLPPQIYFLQNSLLHPPFSLIASKKTGRARSKRNRFCRQIACGHLRQKTGVRIRDKLLKSVPIVWRARNWILKKPFTASKRLHKRGPKRILSASFSAAAPPVYGGGIQRRGPAGPFLCVVRGRGAKSKRPHVSGGAWGGVFAPKTSPNKKKEPAFSGWLSFKYHFLSRS